MGGPKRNAKSCFLEQRIVLHALYCNGNIWQVRCAQARKIDNSVPNHEKSFPLWIICKFEARDSVLGWEKREVTFADWQELTTLRIEEPKPVSFWKPKVAM